MGLHVISNLHVNKGSGIKEAPVEDDNKGCKMLLRHDSVHEWGVLMSRTRTLWLLASRCAPSLVGKTAVTGKPSSLWGCVRVVHRLIPMMWQSFCPFVFSLKTRESKYVKRCSALLKIAAWHIFYPQFSPWFSFPSCLHRRRFSLKTPLEAGSLPPFL